MECVSLICYVVGPERCKQDALRTMEILARTPPDQMDPDDPQVLLVACQYSSSFVQCYNSQGLIASFD